MLGGLLDDPQSALVSLRAATSRSGVPDTATIVQATSKDKKRLGEGPTPFVLLEAPGAPRPGCPVDPGELQHSADAAAGDHAGSR